MKMKTRLMTLMALPLLYAAGVAMAQGIDPGAAGMPDEVQTSSKNQVQGRTDVRDSHDRHRERSRQGRDMRRCLSLKTNAAIIRCAESGRRP